MFGKRNQNPPICPISKELKFSVKFNRWFWVRNTFGEISSEDCWVCVRGGVSSTMSMNDINSVNATTLWSQRWWAFENNWWRSVRRKYTPFTGDIKFFYSFSVSCFWFNNRRVWLFDIGIVACWSCLYSCWLYSRWCRASMTLFIFVDVIRQPIISRPRYLVRCSWTGFNSCCTWVVLVGSISNIHHERWFKGDDDAMLATAAIKIEVFISGKAKEKASVTYFICWPPCVVPPIARSWPHQMRHCDLI